MDNNTQQSPHWLSVLRIIATVSIPLILGFYGNHINSTIKDKEIELRYVEIALDILKSKPTDETNALREWAIEVVQTNSIVPLSINVKSELQSHPLPKDYGYTYDRFDPDEKRVYMQ